MGRPVQTPEERREEMETEANYFAMCLLLPEDMVREDVERLRGEVDVGEMIEKIAERYRVEAHIVTLRLVELKLLRGVP